MKLGFFTMPIHPLEKDWRQSLAEDREAFILADQLGLQRGLLRRARHRHAPKTSRPAPCSSSTLVDATRRIKLGTGTVNLPNSHPVTVASQIAMLDHLLDGRFIFGISPGGLLSDAEAYGNLDADRNAMFVEAINQMHGDLAGRAALRAHRQVLERRNRAPLHSRDRPGISSAKPLQRPHPPIVVTVVAPFSKGVTEAAARGWDPISANFLMPAWVKSHWPNYVEGCDARRPAGRSG